MLFDALNRENVILWGIGNLYNKHRDFIKNELRVRYVYDRRFDNSDEREYDGYEVITRRKINDIRDFTIIICMMDDREMDRIETEMETSGCRTVRLVDLLPIDRRLSTKEILEKMHNGVYKDRFGNVIRCNSCQEMDRISFRFNGSNAVVNIGKNIHVSERLKIECGNDCSVMIGDRTTFDDVVILSAYAGVTIGFDCMLSYGVYIRNHDSHFIFDKQTGERINYSSDITLGNHVWIGQNCMLLPGFKLGHGSVFGAGAVSSSEFEENAIIAGNPAKVIRRGIEWNRETTWTNDYDNLIRLKGNYQ